MSSILNRQPRCIISILQEPNQSIMQGLLNLIHFSNSTFFNYLPVNTPETANCALTIIDFCINSPDVTLGINALSDISESPLFTVALVTAFKFTNEVTISLLRRLLIFLKENHFNNQGSFFHKLFLKTTTNLLDNKKSEVFPYYYKDNFTFVSTHFFEVASVVDESLFSIESYLNIYLTFLMEFINHPTITGAYIVYNYPYMIFQNLFSEDEIPQKFSEKIIQISQDPQICITTKFSIDSTFMSSVFIDPLEKGEIITDINIFDIPLKYPKFSKKLLETIIEVFNTKFDLVRMVYFAREVYSRFGDFSMLFGVTKRDNEIILALFKTSKSVSTWDTFEPLFLLSIHTLYCKWNCGLLTKRQECMNFVMNEIDDMRIRYFIYHLLICSTSEIYNPQISDVSEETQYSWQQKDTPFQVMSSLFVYLMKTRNPNLDQLSASLKEHNFLWLPVMVWGIIKKPSGIDTLLTIPRAKSNLYKDYFYMMMIHISPPPQVWIGCLNYANYDLKVRFPPPSLNLILPYIKRGIVATQSVKTLHESDLVNISLSWRSWISIFGFEPFFEKLLEFLKHFVISHPDSNAISSTYIVSSMLLSSAIRSFDMDVGGAIIKYVKNSLVDMRNPTHFSVFSLILLMNYKERDKNFPKIYQYIDDVISNSQTASSPQTVFALSFLKSSMKLIACSQYFESKLNQKLINLNDWQTAIDIYLMK